MCLVGHGIATDLVQAHKWFALAEGNTSRELGDKPQRHRLQAEARMDAPQLAQAVRLAQEWQPRR